MKKAITICLLAVSLLAGGMAMDAKTPGGKATAKTSKTHSQSGAFTLTCLLHKENRSGFMFNSDSKIEAALKKAGFSLKSKNVTRGEIADGTEGDTSPGKIIDFVYTKKGITVEWTSYVYDEAPNNPYKDRIVINFSDSAAKDSFIKSVKSNGYKLDYGTYVDPNRTIDIKVEGNKVILEGNWG